MTKIFPEFRTPPLEHPRLGPFACSIRAYTRPVKVPMAANLRPLGCCYWNVAAVVQDEGGDAVYGWQFLYWPGYIMEAMHHAVWRQPNGEMLDVTEKHPTDSVQHHSVFIQDDSVSVDLMKPPYVRSRHLALSKCDEVRSFMEAYSDKNDCERKIADLFYQHGYRGEAQFAAALGIPFDWNAIPHPPAAALDPINAQLEAAQLALGAAIVALEKRACRAPAVRS